MTTARWVAMSIAAAMATVGCRSKTDAVDTTAPAPTDPPSTATEPPEPAKPVRIVYPAAPGSFVDLAEELIPSVVTIKSGTKVTGGPTSAFVGADDEYALGSGFVVNRDGHILTNDHVIANATDVRVVLVDGVEAQAQIVGRDAALDIALLKIEGSPRLQPARLGDSDNVRVGEWVVAIGNPFGLEHTVTAGIVSAKDRTERDVVMGRGRGSYRSFIQTDATINPGNSGGPLANTAGEVVGIATAIDNRGAGIGYAIPINRAKQIMPMLKTDGVVTRSWLGVFIRPVTVDLAQRLGLPEPRGAFVTDVVESGPAAKAGIIKGDVILQYDTRDVTHKDLPWIAATTRPGRTVKVVVWRNRGERALDLVAAKMPK